MPSQVSDTVTINKKAAMRMISLAIVAIVTILVWFLWHSVYMSPTRVFWDMIDNNLSTPGVTRHVSQKSGSQSLDQYLRIAFGSKIVVDERDELRQNQTGGQSSVISESIGTKDNDYNRYVSIDSLRKNSSGGKIDTSQITGVWGKTDDPTPGQTPKGIFLKQSLIKFITPFANLNQVQRQSIIQQMKDSKVYDISTGNTTSEKVNGRSVYVYDVGVNPQAYVEMMVKILHYIGIGDIGLNSAQYAGAPTLHAKFAVDKLSRQLVKINFVSSGQEEVYVSQGLETPIDIPSNTIPLSQLQLRIQNTLK